jgi:hypothetical protein
MNLPYNNKPPSVHQGCCPHCNTQDGGGHITGGCTHPAMKSIFIHRHNEAGKIISRYISKSKLGNFAKYGDLHSIDNRPEDILDRQVPDWVCPKEGQASTPDLVILNGIPRQRAQNMKKNQAAPATWKKDTHILLVEIGYCQDYDYGNKLYHKIHQHWNLAMAIRKQGWEKVTTVELIFGNAGTMYSGTTHSLETQLEISVPRLKKLIPKLVRHAYYCTHMAICQRRKLDTG